MVPPFSRRWLHPQTVPRGFLRMYILTLLSKGPGTGYSMIQVIGERTDGAWRPGAGTMYPLLKSLVKEGLVRADAREKKAGSKAYALTKDGRKELEEMRRHISGFGKRDPVMGRLFSDLMPGSLFVPLVLDRIREGSTVLREKMRELPPEEREAALEELRLAMRSQLRWIDSELATLHPPENTA